LELLGGFQGHVHEEHRRRSRVYGEGLDIAGGGQVEGAGRPPSTGHAHSSIGPVAAKRRGSKFDQTQVVANCRGSTLVGLTLYFSPASTGLLEVRGNFLKAVPNQPASCTTLSEASSGVFSQLSRRAANAGWKKKNLWTELEIGRGVGKRPAAVSGSDDGGNDRFSLETSKRNGFGEGFSQRSWMK